MGLNKYNEIENTMKLEQMASESGGGWEKESGHKKISALCQYVWNNFNYPEATEVRREMSDIYPDRRFC